jgi:hypothetical protein
MYYNGTYKALITHNSGPLIAKIVPQFGLVTVTRNHEVGFGSNLRVEREGEYSNSVRINRPSPLEISPFSEIFYFNFICIVSYFRDKI